MLLTGLFSTISCSNLSSLPFPDTPNICLSNFTHKLSALNLAVAVRSSFEDFYSLRKDSRSFL
jgi:hypothetical protein